MRKRGLGDVSNPETVQLGTISSIFPYILTEFNSLNAKFSLKQHVESGCQFRTKKRSDENVIIFFQTVSS